MWRHGYCIHICQQKIPLIIVLIALTIIINSFIVSYAAEGEGGGGGGADGQGTTAGGGQTKTAGKNNDEDEGNGNGVGDTKVAGRGTPELCQYQPFHADPLNPEGLEVLPGCASCVSRAMQDGDYCYQNTWTFKTGCQCKSETFRKCWCFRELNFVAAGGAFAIPLLLAFFYVGLHLCTSYEFCPLYAIEMKAQLMKKAQAQEIKSLVTCFHFFGFLYDVFEMASARVLVK